MKTAEMQIGKNGITENFVQTLKTCFEKHESVRISVLKSAGHNKQDIKKYSEEILEKLGKKYTAKLIGFKIIVKKWRKAR
jgi:RNA-binding protein YhbY